MGTISLHHYDAINADDWVVTWLLAISGLSTLFTWLAICLCQYVINLSLSRRYGSCFAFSIRFRAAWKVQGHSLEELPYRAMGGVYGSWFGVVLICLILIAQFYVVSGSPSWSHSIIHLTLASRLYSLLARQFMGKPPLKPSSVSTSARDGLCFSDDFFPEVYLAAPVMILFYIIGFAWKRKLPKRASEIDLDVCVLRFICQSTCITSFISLVWTEILANSGRNESIPCRTRKSSSKCQDLPRIVLELKHWYFYTHNCSLLQ